MGCCQSKESEPTNEHPEVLNSSSHPKDIKDLFNYPQSSDYKKQLRSEPLNDAHKEKSEKNTFEEYGQELSNIYSKQEAHKESEGFYQVCQEFSIKKLDDLAYPYNQFGLILGSLSVLSENRE